MPSRVDCIVVGQGLAGSAVAIQLLRYGKKILVIDAPSENNSSRIAAGLFNPITGKKLVKTWMADTLFPYLYTFYQDIERLTQKKFFYPMSLYRPFISIQEQNEWMGRSADHTYDRYVDLVHGQTPFDQQVKDPFGGMTLKQCGFLDAQAYLEAVRGYLEGSASYREQMFDQDQLNVDNDQVVYQGCRADKIIFCQGEKVNNKWFKGLPIQPLKGEILTIKSQWDKHVILNRGVYMVPGSVSGE